MRGLQPRGPIDPRTQYFFLLSKTTKDIGGFFGDNLLLPVKKTITNFGYIMTMRKNTRLGLIPKADFYTIPQCDVFFFVGKILDYGNEEILRWETGSG
jgi:hypothetical protein